MPDDGYNSGGAVPLITLHKRQNYQRLDNGNLDSGNLDSGNLDSGNLDVDTTYPGPSYQPSYQPSPHTMARGPSQGLHAAGSKKKQPGVAVALSYVFDWAILLVILGVAYYMGHHEPNRRPFSLEDPNISFPYTEHETVPPWLLVTLSAGLPILVIPFISLILVPGRTVPRGTPASLIWKRKLWELHAGWLGLALSIASTWFITNGMKNLFGKPRPDLLARCNPDVDNYAQYVVGGLQVADGFQRLVSANICRGRTDIDMDLADGFRSYPSGHASSAAAGLIYLSLFVASKFAITFPFLALPGTGAAGHHAPRVVHSAFPSRSQFAQQQQALIDAQQRLDAASDPAATRLFSTLNARVASARQQAAAPPVYLLIFATAPFFTSIFIASSRWFDFRHHGFDILFGYLIGTISAFFAFRWYHLPMSQGAGWAWGPRCADKAFWAGVGSFSYAMEWEDDLDESGVAMWTSADGSVAAEEGRGLKGLNLAHMGGLGSASFGDDEARRRMG